MTQSLYDKLLTLLSPGTRVFLHAGASESNFLADALRSDPARVRDVTFAGAFIPGLNKTDYTLLAPGVKMITTFVTPALEQGFSAGRITFLPKAYSGFARWLLRNPPDLAILRVAPPDTDGRMSYGINQDFAPIAAHCAKRIVALVDHAMPAFAGEPGLLAEDCTALIPIREPLIPVPAASPDTRLAQIGTHAASLVRDGDTIQIGIGKVQAAILGNLSDRRNLGLHSGLIDDAIAALAAKGVLTNARKSLDRNTAVAGMVIGTQKAWDYSQQSSVRLRAADYTHAAGVLAQQEHFVAINSALEIDLFGQCNAEWLDGRQVSGAGGFHDFQRGAAASAGGRSIVALPATAGTASRIVSQFARPGLVTGPRNDVDYIVTEYGIAALSDLTLDARADALIAIAGPAHRNRLAQEWQALRKAM